MDEKLMEEKYKKAIDEFNQYPEDQQDIINICNTATVLIYQKFSAKIDEPRSLAVMVAEIFNAIVDKLVEKTTKYSDFEINICNRLVIGYTSLTNIDSDDEKLGNIQMYVRHLNTTQKYDIDTVFDPDETPNDKAVRWNTQNSIQNPEILREISVIARDRIEQKFDICIGTSELIIPMFVITYEAMVNYLKIQRRELNNAFQKEINFLGCFTIGARESDTDIDDIYIISSIEMKLKGKNDAIASSKFE